MLASNLSLIRHFTAEDQATLPRRATGVMHFCRDEFNLYYINATHVVGTNNSTCETINRAFLQHPIKAVVCEMVHGGGRSDIFDRHIQDAAARNFEKDSESTYVAYLANEKTIPLVGGEPAIRQTFLELNGKGYTNKDVLCFFLLQYLPGLKRQNKLEERRIEQQALNTLAVWSDLAQIEKKERIGLLEYKEWFVNHYPERENWLDVTTEDAAPFLSPTARIGRTMAYETDFIREPHIIKTITDMLNQHKSVLVVYGATHLEKHLPVLEDMLGVGQSHILAPKRDCLETRIACPTRSP